MRAAGRRLIRLAPVVLLLLLTGCWDMKSIQDTDYYTALGFDYENGRHVVYAQMLDFSNVAKQQSGKPNAPGGVWVGRGEGQTVVDALDSLVRTSQQRVFYGHIGAFVFSEKALKLGIRSYMDGLIRFREIRYTQWIYGTKEPIGQLFSVKPFFNLSPLISILHQPEGTYMQQSHIRPMRLHRVVTQLREPGETLLLPSLEIDRSDWKRDGESDPKLAMGGIFAIHKGHFQGFMDRKQLDGLRWVDRRTLRATTLLEDKGKYVGNVTIKHIKPVLLPKKGAEEQAKLTLRFKCTAYVNEMLQPMDEATIRKAAADEIRKQLEATYAAGQERHIDLYKLEHVLYYYDFPAWSRLTDNGTIDLEHYDFEIESIHVELSHTGMFKKREKGRQY